MKTMEGIRTLLCRRAERFRFLGQGTWQMGEDPDKREEELVTVRHGLDLGMNLIM
jgi:aryl-alcohol dehydrogenase-like predicted oxidoreductase